MTAPVLGGIEWIKLVADPTTPPEWQPYAGRIVGIEQGGPAATTLGSGPDNLGQLIGLSGYPLTISDPLTTIGFVMTKTDQVTASFIANLLPDGTPEQIASIQAQAQTLIAAGVAAADVRTAFQRVVDTSTAVAQTAASLSTVQPLPPTPSGPVKP